MKIYLAHANSYDYQARLYSPIRTSVLNESHEFFLPHEAGRKENTKVMMKDFDLVLAEVSVPATGLGIELGRADIFRIPILCLYEKGAKISNSLKYVTTEFIEYDGAADMLQKLAIWLARRAI